jgi:hypothetical protein
VSTGVWLLPLTILSLLVALWGFAAAAIARRGYGPLLIGLAAAFALVIGKFSCTPTLDRRICSADICIFLECVAARQQTRLCRWFRIRMRIGNLTRFKALYLAKSYDRIFKLIQWPGKKLATLKISFSEE